MNRETHFLPPHS